MQLEGVGVTQPEKHGPYQIRQKFGTQCVLRYGSADRRGGC